MELDLFLKKLNEKIIKYDVDVLYHHAIYTNVMANNLDAILITSKEKQILPKKRTLLIYENEIKEYADLDVFVDYVFKLIFPRIQIMGHYED